MCRINIIRRKHHLATKGEEVNRILSNILSDCIKLVSNNNLNESHLNRSKLHLNKGDTGAFPHNIIQFLRSLKLYDQTTFQPPLNSFSTSQISLSAF